MIALLLRHWRAVAIVAAVAVIAVGMVTWRVYRAGEAAGRAACEASHTAALDAARAAQERRDREYRGTLSAREAALVVIAAPLPPPDPRALVREVIREADCRCPVIGESFSVRWNADSRRAREIAAGAVPR